MRGSGQTAKSASLTSERLNSASTGWPVWSVTVSSTLASSPGANVSLRGLTLTLSSRSTSKSLVALRRSRPSIALTARRKLGNKSCPTLMDISLSSFFNSMMRWRRMVSPSKVTNASPLVRRECKRTFVSLPTLRVAESAKSRSLTASLASDTSTWHWWLIVWPKRSVPVTRSL